MSLTKKYAKDKKTCKVTFKLPKGAVEGYKTAHVAGEFNNWDPAATPLKKARDGSLSVSLELASGREYQYRYLLGDHIWVNDEAADKYVYSEFADTENSVVEV